MGNAGTRLLEPGDSGSWFHDAELIAVRNPIHARSACAEPSGFCGEKGLARSRPEQEVKPIFVMRVAPYTGMLVSFDIRSSNVNNDGNMFSPQPDNACSSHKITTA